MEQGPSHVSYSGTEHAEDTITSLLETGTGGKEPGRPPVEDSERASPWKFAAQADAETMGT